MQATRNPKRFTAILAASLLGLAAAVPVSAADTLTPSPVSVSLVAGTSTTINKTLSLDGLPARADIIVAIDTTGSMTAPIAQAQADASSICSNVKASIPGARFAAVDFEDYPGMPLGAASDTPYILLTPGFISDCTAFSAAIGTMAADGGGDGPEAYNRAFFEAYSDAAYGAPGRGRRARSPGQPVPRRPRRRNAAQRGRVRLAARMRRPTTSAVTPRPAEATT